MMSVMKSRQTDERTHWLAASPLQPNKSKTSEQVPGNLAARVRAVEKEGVARDQWWGLSEGSAAVGKRSVCSIHSSHNMAPIKKPQQRHIKEAVDAADDKVVPRGL